MNTPKTTNTCIGHYEVGYGVTVEIHQTNEKGKRAFSIAIQNGEQAIALPGDAAPGTQLALQEAHGQIIEELGQDKECVRRRTFEWLNSTSVMELLRAAHDRGSVR